jgi:hypothetical protein
MYLQSCWINLNAPYTLLANLEGNGMSTPVLDVASQLFFGFRGFGEVNVFHVIGLLLV